MFVTVVVVVIGAGVGQQFAVSSLVRGSLSTRLLATLGWYISSIPLAKERLLKEDPKRSIQKLLNV